MGSLYCICIKSTDRRSRRDLLLWLRSRSRPALQRLHLQDVVVCRGEIGSFVLSVTAYFWKWLRTGTLLSFCMLKLFSTSITAFMFELLRTVSNHECWLRYRNIYLI